MTDHPGATAARRARGLILLLAVFAAGVVAGLAIERVLAPASALETRLTTRAPRILDELALTPGQRRSVDSILARRDARVEAMMRETIPRLAAITDAVHAEVAAVLTPPQRARFDAARGERTLLLKRRTPGRGERVDTVLRQ